MRGTFPGFAIQVGNFIAAATANIQIWLASGMGGDFGLAMAITVAIMVVATGILTAAGPKSRPGAFEVPPS
jgi:SHS family lactate transporter-like MFS transporter